MSLWKPLRSYNQVFFTADTHFGHNPISSMAKRPFTDLKDMEESLIKNWNDKVSEDDCTFVIGDMFVTSKLLHIVEVVNRLNGQIYLVPGSHDRYLGQIEKATRGKLKPTEQIVVLNMGPEILVLCHCALRIWPMSHYGSYLAYAHTHGRLLPQGKSWDVGMDVNNFYPLSWPELKEIMESRPQNIDIVNDGGEIFWPYPVEEYDEALSELPTPDEVITKEGLGRYAYWWETWHKKLLGRLKSTTSSGPFFTKKS